MPVTDPATAPPPDSPYRFTRALPPHLESWQLPPDWRWGNEGIFSDTRHYQEVIDALGRSLSLVSAPDPGHAADGRVSGAGPPDVPEGGGSACTAPGGW